MAVTGRCAVKDHLKEMGTTSKPARVKAKARDQHSVPDKEDLDVSTLSR